VTPAAEITVSLPMALARKINDVDAAAKEELNGKISAFYMVWYQEPEEVPAPGPAAGSIAEGEAPRLKPRLPTKLVRAQAAHSGRDNDAGLKELTDTAGNAQCAQEGA